MPKIEKINKVYQPLAILIQKNTEKMQITNISFERSVVTTDLKDIKRTDNKEVI